MEMISEEDSEGSPEWLDAEDEDAEFDEQAGGGKSGDCEMSRLRAMAMVEWWSKAKCDSVTYVTHRL